jgi:hypothetical protein
MFHACVERFDVLGGRGNILGWDGEVNKAYIVKYAILLFFAKKEQDTIPSMTITRQRHGALAVL